MNAREAAYLALLSSLKTTSYITDSLEAWHRQYHPTSQDFRLAHEIAYGACRMALALDEIARQLSTEKKLNLKLKEKALLRTAVYQYAFMDKIPPYAIANETLLIANKHCHPTFVKYLNATLRQLSGGIPPLPQGDSLHALSIRHSYPLEYVQTLLDSYGVSKTKSILEAGNQAGKTTVRIRNNATEDLKGLNVVCTTPFPMAIVEDPSLIPLLTSSPDYYIQNITPATLLGHLCQHRRSPPTSILDLCASPGGKLIALHDAYPHAELYANDISPAKLRLIEENCTKYGITADLSCADGTTLSLPQRFDLIILDVPCSNSGVFNKRPEARWRYSIKALHELQAKQQALIANALTMLSPQGELWYMTCSILKEENESLMDKVCNDLSLTNLGMETFLPTLEGRDGGFACRLQRISGSSGK